MKTVRDILVAKGGEVWWIRPDASVFEALGLMRAKDIGALLVKDSRRGVVGIFSERDYARKVALQGKTSRGVPVEDVMTPASCMVVARPDSRVDECMAVMTEKHIRHLPVQERSSIVGMVSSRDLIEACLEAGAGRIDNLHDLCHTFFSHHFDDEIAGRRD